MLGDQRKGGGKVFVGEIMLGDQRKGGGKVFVGKIMLGDQRKVGGRFLLVKLCSVNIVKGGGFPWLNYARRST